MHDIATREEQLLLDRRAYVAVTATADFPAAPPSGLNLTVPKEMSGKYDFSRNGTCWCDAADFHRYCYAYRWWNPGK